MPYFFVLSPHSADQCLAVKAELLDRGPESLLQFVFGCALGDGTNHTAYAILEARDELEALASVPPIVQDKAIGTAVARISPEEVRQQLGL